ncbi:MULTISPECIES: type II secretion system F family protein [Brevibacillus]|uniref:Type II secretion system F family protein n=1 Tax=Brevibacillus brevis TaxID=1393 RepID=A0ABY9TCR4_BREBE|nr:MULTISPECIES: type II secretion system F family protein [Brevibacillus]MBG9568467.1 hypothetical protein [Brevibacillus agri]WNC17900.1 type II secretion system F family protein [Brevibacillus brevis]
MVVMGLYLNPVYVFLVPFVIGAIFLSFPLMRAVSRSFVVLSRKRYFGRKRPKEDVVQLDLTRFPLFRSFAYYMDLAGFKISPLVIVLIGLVIACVALVASRLLMKSVLNNIIVAVMFGSIPFLIVWQKYQITTHRISRIMVPVIQNFTGFLSETDNITSAIHRSATQMPFEIRREWDRLCTNINTGTPLEEALLEFATRVNNDWADDFVDILITRIETGSDITPSLFKLVEEIQNASFNEERRITVMSIYRWGIFLMIIMSAIIVYVNIKLDPKNYFYYFEHPFGSDFVTFSCVVMFGSFIGALMMGRRNI